MATQIQTALQEISLDDDCTTPYPIDDAAMAQQSSSVINVEATPMRDWLFTVLIEFNHKGAG